jgi:hypothetical protein
MKIANGLVLLIFCLTAISVGCNLFPRTPSQTVSRFWELSRQGKTEEAEKLLTKYSAASRERGGQTYAQIISNSAKSRPISSVKIENETVNGNQAMVTATVTREDGAMVVKHDLIKEDGEWRIDSLH